MKLIQPFGLLGVVSLLGACGGNAVSSGEPVQGQPGSGGGGSDPLPWGGWSDPGGPNPDPDPGEPSRPRGPGIDPGGPIGPGPVIPVDPGDCEPVSEFSEGGYCQRDAQCGNGTWISTSCDSFEGGLCHCDVGGIFIQIDLGTSEASCDAAEDACLQAVRQFPGVEPVCQTEFSEQGDDFCTGGQQCVTPVPVDGGSAEIFSWSEMWCENYGGSSHCECVGNGSGTTIEFYDEVNLRSTCSTLHDECSAGTLFDPSRASTCAPRTLIAERDWCNVQVLCSQQGTVSGQSALVSVGREGACARTPDGSWECNCGFGGAFSLSGETGWEVCSEAAGRCTL